MISSDQGLAWLQHWQVPSSVVVSQCRPWHYPPPEQPLKPTVHSLSMEAIISVCKGHQLLPVDLTCASAHDAT